MTMEDILRNAHSAGHLACRDIKDKGACGFAWVTIPGNTAFARWCRKRLDANRTDYSRWYGRKGYPKGWTFWNPGHYAGQSIDAIEAGAVAFAEVLKGYGIDAKVGSRLD